MGWWPFPAGLGAKTEGTLAYMRSLPIPRSSPPGRPDRLGRPCPAGRRLRVIIARSGWTRPARSAARRSVRDPRALTATSIGTPCLAGAADDRPDGQSDPRGVHPDFSPPQLPGGPTARLAAAIHSVLRSRHGRVMRGTLASNSFPITLGAFALLGTWCAASFAATSVC